MRKTRLGAASRGPQQEVGEKVGLALSFRAKLLAALVGLVVMILAILLVSLELEISRQVDRAVTSAGERSQEAFAELEQLWVEDLNRLNLRLTQSVRLLGAMEAALEEEDADILQSVAEDEIRLAGISGSLALFADIDDQVLVTLLDGQVMVWPDAQPKPLGLEHDADRSFAFMALGGRLFVITEAPLDFFGTDLGSVVLGTRLDDEVGARLAQVAGSEVVFVIDGEAVISSPGVAEANLAEAMIKAAEDPGSTRVLGRHWALLSEPLSDTDTTLGTRVIAVPLAEVVAPLERMESQLRAVGLIALVLALVVGLLLSRGLSAPLQALTQAIDRVAEGDLDTEVVVQSGDELGRLADAFNQMVRGMALKERYRSLLDKVVSKDVAEEMLKGDIVLGGENRVVTILFADIRGFTPLTEGMEPQEVIAMLNEFMDRAAAAVDQAGGVVDKYVGDEIMAIFGAPVSHGDDAARALVAAVGIRSAVDELNQDRVRRGQPAIAVGIGLHTGIAVAGNMGSKDRLNYTVLGESVNLAARLCSRAAPMQVLASAATVKAAGSGLEADGLEPMTVKGLSVPVEVFSVRAMSWKDVPAGSRDGRRAASTVAACLLAVVMALMPAAVESSDWLYDPPTLLGLGLGYQSESGAVQLDLSGRFILEGYLPGDDPAWLIDEVDPFVAPELSLFADLFLGEHLLAVAELRFDRGEKPTADDWDGRVEQLFLRYSPWTNGALGLQLGKFVSPFGSFPQIHDTSADPFVRAPLSFEYRTMVCSEIIPPHAAGFLTWRDRPEEFRSKGLPPIWGVPYQVGAMAQGAISSFNYRFAVMNSAPSSSPNEWDSWIDDDQDPSYVAHLGYQVTPSFAVGASYNVGPYLSTEVQDSSDDKNNHDGAASGSHEYEQELWAVDLTFTRGWTEIRGEVFIDSWEIPNATDTADETSYYLQIRQKLSASVFVALRYAAIDFKPMDDDRGNSIEWDWDVERWQLAVGYRLNPRLELKAEYLVNRSDGPEDFDDDLAAVQLRWLF